ncbi:unnamed protein product [Phaedon cochleariae]|uniref:Uncharacterized protein n=1 Tax=Phaedon cochleariae TaxID=80249 RepID=A0A9N9SE08_PHACE|nr:unnamed protein product [Phaedon cochleariae]
MQHNFGDLEVVISGGSTEEEHAQSTNLRRNVDCLKSSHEEADTRMVLHAVHTTAHNVVVMTRDTDVVLLLIYHFAKMECSHLWVMSGTARDTKYIPVHDICRKLMPEQVSHLLAFHAITGCDSTSKLASITKVGAWKAFSGTNCELLGRLGQSPLEEDVLSNVEKFVVKLYEVDSSITCSNDARSYLFGAVRKPEFLPPTTDALRLHIKRCNYQVCVWENAHIPKPSLPRLQDCGWIVQREQVVPRLITMSLASNCALPVNVLA